MPLCSNLYVFHPIVFCPQSQTENTKFHKEERQAKLTNENALLATLSETSAMQEPEATT